MITLEIEVASLNSDHRGQVPLYRFTVYIFICNLQNTEESRKELEDSGIIHDKAPLALQRSLQLVSDTILGEGRTLWGESE